MPLNIGLLKSDTTTKGDERYTPDYAVEYLIELLPPPEMLIKIYNLVSFR